MIQHSLKHEPQEESSRGTNFINLQTLNKGLQIITIAH